MKFLNEFISNKWFERTVVLVIILNAITLGLETYPGIMSEYEGFLRYADRGFIFFFVTELLIRITIKQKSFFKEGWNIFDFSIVTVSILPLLGMTGLGNISAFRALRLLRLLSVVPSFRRILRGIGRALQGSFAVMCVLLVILYVFSVVSVKLFRDVSPFYFTDLGTAFFTFFQIMTLDGWSDIVRPIMQLYPLSSLYFAAYIIVTVFILLSIIIGIASNAIGQSEDEK